MSQLDDAQPLPSLVIDFGRGYIKYNSTFSDNIPSSNSSSVVCNETRNVIAIQKGNPDEEVKYMIDIDLRKGHRYAKVFYPMKEGHIKDSNVFEKMIDCLSRDSRVYMAETNTLMGFGPHMTENEMVKVASVMFENFNTPEFGLVLDDCMAAVGSDTIYGTMLDCGYSSTRAVPIFDGVPLMESITELNFGGNNLIMHFLDLLKQSALYTINADYIGDREYFGPYCLERNGYVPLDFEKELKKVKINKIEDLPDLRSAPLNNSVFICTQALFDPSLVGLEDPSIHNLIMQSISKCDEQKQAALSNVVPCGGMSNLKGLLARLEKELKIVSKDSSFVPTLSEMKNRTKLPFIGGSIIVNSRTLFDKFSVKLEDYNEYGESIVKRKFL